MHLTKRRSLEELTLLDRFLFAETMEDPENLRILLEIILGKDLVLKHLPQTEKELRTSPLNRMARVDVWGMDEEGTVYSAESQKRNTGNLPRRSRFYQGMSDSELLEAGEADFNRLSDLYIILIAPFDLFGKGLCRYTFRMRCDESRDLELGDGAVRIFLNTRGTDREGISGELAELLEYIEHTNEKRRVKSPRIEKLKNNVEKIKQSGEVSVRYMQAWEEKIYDRMEGREEGIAIGRERGLREGRENGLREGRQEMLMSLIRKKLAKGKTPEEIAEELEESPETIESLIRESEG